MPGPNDLAEGLPQVSPQQAPQLINLIMKLLDGAGAKDRMKATEQALNTGEDTKQFSDPLIKMGIGAQSLGIDVPTILALIKPPKSQQQQPQRSIQDILPSLAGRIPGNDPARGIVPRPGTFPSPGAIPGGAPGVGAPPGGGLPPPPTLQV